MNKEGGWERTLLKATQSFCILHTLAMLDILFIGKECRDEDLFRVFLRFLWLFYLLEVDTVKRINRELIGHIFSSPLHVGFAGLCTLTHKLCIMG